MTAQWQHNDDNTNDDNIMIRSMSQLKSLNFFTYSEVWLSLEDCTVSLPFLTEDFITARSRHIFCVQRRETTRTTRTTTTTTRTTTSTRTTSSFSVLRRSGHVTSRRRCLLVQFGSRRGSKIQTYTHILTTYDCVLCQDLSLYTFSFVFVFVFKLFVSFFWRVVV